MLRHQNILLKQLLEFVCGWAGNSTNAGWNTVSEASQHVIRILEVLIERTQNALDAFDHGDDDQALVALKKREIGFANLRTAEFLSSIAGWELKMDPAAVKRVGQLLEMDKKLLTSLQLARDRSEREVRRVQKVRQRLNRYHSGTQEGSRFEKSV